MCMNLLASPFFALQACCQGRYHVLPDVVGLCRFQRVPLRQCPWGDCTG